MGGRKLREHLQRLQIQPRRLLYIPLLPLDIRQIIQRVGVGGTQLEGGVVALLRLGDEALLLQRVGEVAVGVGEVGLQFDGAAVGVDGEVNEALLAGFRIRIRIQSGRWNRIQEGINDPHR